MNFQPIYKNQNNQKYQVRGAGRPSPGRYRLYPGNLNTGRMIGIVSVSFQPADLIRSVAEEMVKDTPFTVMVMQPDGVILYDPDPGEIGRNTLTDPLYAGFPEIQEIAWRASGNWSGSGSYRFAGTGSQTIVEKETFWTTIGIHGSEWRLFITRTIT
jgi:hypothetical protein